MGHGPAQLACDHADMAFGQQSGPPASGRQLKELIALLEQVGYASFREARHPLGFSQRQAGGKFTSDEAAAFIEQLEQLDTDTERDSPVEPIAGRTPPATVPMPSAIATERREARQAASIRDLPAPVLARELERRGWILIPPDDLTAPAPPAPPPSTR